jgi:hypothetical protein
MPDALRDWHGPASLFHFHLLGETQIMNGQGEILARRSRDEGAGVITADITLGEVPGERLSLPDRFWIPEMPDAAISTCSIGHG